MGLSEREQALEALLNDKELRFSRSDGNPSMYTLYTEFHVVEIFCYDGSPSRAYSLAAGGAESSHLVRWMTLDKIASVLPRFGPTVTR